MLSSIMHEMQPEEAHAEPTMIVHVKLPSNVASADQGAVNVSDYVWTNVLDFPVHKLLDLHFSKRPYKWIQYATGVVLGAEGHLHKGEDVASNQVDYEAETLPYETTELYYHTSTLDFLPIDPDFADGTKTSVATRKRHADFRRRVLARDGDICVVTDTPAEHCDAVHIVAFRKGDDVRNIPPFSDSLGLINKSILKGSLQHDNAMNPTS